MRILLAGCGIGSVIAECALRIGFENIVLADGDTVEESNLNRQNYLHRDVGRSKCESIKERLLSINPSANIRIHNYFLNGDNIGPLVNECDIAINALDFKDDTPFVFDRLCRKKNIPVLHPYNIGWGGLVYVMMPDDTGLESISDDPYGFEKKAVSFFIDKLDPSSPHKKWIMKVLTRYEKENGILPPPQLSVASWLLAGSCADLLFKLATGRRVKAFPLFYFTTTY